MTTFKWSQNYSVDIPEIDEQHKQIIDFLNQLDRAKIDRTEKETIENIANSLIEYAKNHLECEEGYMKEYAYPDSEEHLKEHEEFRRKIKAINREIQSSGHNPGGILKASIMLQQWLMWHIQVTDRRLGEYLKQQGM